MKVFSIFISMMVNLPFSFLVSLRSVRLFFSSSSRFRVFFSLPEAQSELGSQYKGTPRTLLQFVILMFPLLGSSFLCFQFLLQLIAYETDEDFASSIKLYKVELPACPYLSVSVSSADASSIHCLFPLLASSLFLAID